MEIYSPKKFQPASFCKNEKVVDKSPKQNNHEIIRFSSKKKPEKVSGEGIGERMKRVFYERLKAFFEYEEVS